MGLIISKAGLDERQIEHMIDYAWSLVKTPYVWGGDKPTVGLDCSGFILELFKAIGVVTAKDMDMTAQGIYNFLKSDPYLMGDVSRGDIVFLGQNKNRITHIALAIDELYMIEAGGEGREASDAGMVRLRPITWRNDFVAAKAVRI